MSDTERAVGALDGDRFAAARQSILDDGLVVLDDLVPIEVIEHLAERMYADVPDLVRSFEGRRLAYPGHLQQTPPSDSEYLHPEVLANQIVVALVRSLLGNDLTTIIYTANTNMPGSVRQRVHCDLVQLQPDLDPVPRSPYSVVCNLSLIDTTPDNAVELWPGSHTDGRTHGRHGTHRDIPADWQDERRSVRGPIQVPQRRGSVLLRDARLWHAGVSNTGARPRVMVAVGYAPAWYSGYSVPVPPTVAKLLDRLGIPPAARL